MYYCSELINWQQTKLNLKKKKEEKKETLNEQEEF